MGCSFHTGCRWWFVSCQHHLRVLSSQQTLNAPGMFTASTPHASSPQVQSKALVTAREAAGETDLHLDPGFTSSCAGAGLTPSLVSVPSSMKWALELALRAVQQCK